MTRTLLLDLDGTLVDTVPDIAAALNRLMRSRSLPPFTVPQVAGMVGDGVAALVRKAMTARGQPPDEAAIGAFSADYGAHVAIESRLFPDVEPVLHALRRDGWTLAVCTNKPEAAARTLLTVLGLMPLLSAVGGGDSFPARKPDPVHLLSTLALAGGRPERAVMLGDHHNDVVAARGAGMACVFAAWGYGAAEMGHGSAGSAADMPAAAALADRLVPADA